MKKELHDCMTSELLFQAMKAEHTSYTEKVTLIAEYNRRLKVMGLTDEQIKKFRDVDETAINKGCYINPDVLLATEPFIKAGMNVSSIKMENCTFSELVFLTDESTCFFDGPKRHLPNETWQLICLNALQNGIGKSAKETYARMKTIGLTKTQKRIFIKNEILITNSLHNETDKIAW